MNCTSYPMKSLILRVIKKAAKIVHKTPRINV